MRVVRSVLLRQLHAVPDSLWNGQLIFPYQCALYGFLRCLKYFFKKGREATAPTPQIQEKDIN
jgi:hypothetical protein